MSEPIASPVPRPVQCCRLSLAIEKNGRCKSYRVRPVALPDAVAAYRLLSSEGADYLVCLKPDGSCSCECFASSKAADGACKHVLALQACGLLPVMLVSLLAEYRDHLALAEAQLDSVRAELAALKAPKKRGRPRKVPAAPSANQVA